MTFPLFQYVQTDPPTKETLSQLVIQLIQYQETKLGKNAQDSSMTTRLPVSTSENCGIKLLLTCRNMFRCDFSWISNLAELSVSFYPQCIDLKVNNVGGSLTLQSARYVLKISINKL